MYKLQAKDDKGTIICSVTFERSNSVEHFIRAFIHEGYKIIIQEVRTKKIDEEWDSSDGCKPQDIKTAQTF